jgi:hypothetical protein
MSVTRRKRALIAADKTTIKGTGTREETGFRI